MKRKAKLSNTQRKILDLADQLKKAKDQVERLETQFRKLSPDCTHVYKDGSSAINSGYFCNSCNICNWDDMGL